ncbi:DUF3667 domain-containing protein [Flammeovirga aprica]|uniref:DUF3667 domain-containing protein n=1 Tax=Flammeovirga aprica JL-4 TaxID=694437 RepID=A0A7X9RUG5_9BACT|nr:DUF3667 domain-containing protein [Flammeovirga aprica]NME68932.1 DUF3667 domain-containing protein [Flammeovirga aprica JL-4]
MQSLKKNCTNCDHEFESDEHFCPSCGQSRANYNTNFLRIIKDYINEAFGIDSKLKHTFLPFFTKPQFLTEEYLSGRRQSYVHPVRLYLISSLFFLFIFNNVIIDKHSFSLDLEKHLPKERDTPLVQINAEEEEEAQKVEVLVDSIKSEYQVNDDLGEVEDEEDDDDGSLLSKADDKRIKDIIWFIRETETVDDQTIEDSLGITSWYQVKMIKQAQYFYKEKGVTFFQTVIENIPIAIMLLVPLFGLYLKLLYIRNRENLYIQHLLFSVHLHAFTLFMFGSMILINLIPWGIKSWMLFVFYFYWTAVVLIMFKKFYKQGWAKTIIKLFLASSIHSIMIFWVILFEIVISLLIF